MLAKIVEKFGKAIHIAPRDAMMAESGLKNGRAFGIQRTFDKLGAVIGIIISYFLITNNFVTNYKKVFLISTIPVGFGIFLLFFLKQDYYRKKLILTLKNLTLKLSCFF